ncbi:MAG TPA: MarR family transcriptional regulator, partial [Methanosarcinaceae archaeon]|nr:MarR family transcriptional regulator [Methanosarcinaceae archaeon]
MNEQTIYFDERVFESVISGVVDFYKVTSPLVKITEASEENRGEISEKNSGRLVDGLVDGLVETDTINLLPDNERTVFDEMQSNPKVTANELSEILNINLRSTKNIIKKLKERGLVKRMGSRKA